MQDVIFLLCFLLIVAFLLVLDLGVFHKKDHVITFKESTLWTLFFIALAFLFFIFIRWHGELVHDVHDMDHLRQVVLQHGHDMTVDDALPYEENLKAYKHTLSIEFITGYLIEKSLSVDNIFVMIMIFLAFGVDKQYYHRVLFYGILGAIVLRFIFIFAAGALIRRFNWVLYVFGLFLVFTGVKMFMQRNKKEAIDVEHHPAVRFLSKHRLSTPQFEGHNFFSRVGGRTLCTPLFVVLLIIEFSDVVFAFDSIPAVYGVTGDPYIVFTSNVLAILGLRSMFFMLESVMDKFVYLKVGLAVLLTFIGVKMLLPLAGVHIGTGVSLIAIVSILTLSIVLSLLFPPKKKKEAAGSAKNGIN